MRPSNKDLSELYPTPKTFDEIEQENIERQKRIAARAPQHIVATTAGRLFAIYTLAGLVLFVIPDLVMTGSIYGVAVSFLFGIVWLWVAILLLRQIVNDQYALAINSQSFFGIYIVVLATLLAAVSLFIHPEGIVAILLTLLGASIWHFTATWIALKTLARITR